MGLPPHDDEQRHQGRTGACDSAATWPGEIKSCHRYRPCRQETAPPLGPPANIRYAAPMRILRFLFWLLVVAIITIAGLLVLATSSTPLPGTQYALSRGDIAHAEALLHQHDPRRRRNSPIRHLLLSQHDLNVALNYLLKRTKRGSTDIRLTRGRMAVRLSLKLPELLPHSWINLQLAISEANPYPRITELKIGALTLPKSSLPALSRLAHRILSKDSRTGPILDMVQRVRFFDGRLYALYHWNLDSLDTVRTSLLGALDQQSLDFYYTELAKTSRRFRVRTKVSLYKLLPPLFEAARRRSLKHDPISENRALLAILAAWVGGHGMSTLVSDHGDKPRPQKLYPVLRGRRDLAQHFLISAGITIGSDTGLANAIGLYKEIRDSWRGSGFSFTDLAADMAGTRFGERATISVKSASEVQKIIAGGIHDSDLLPRIEDLPERLSADTFSRRFSNTDSDAYQKILAEIESRLDVSILLKRE